MASTPGTGGAAVARRGRRRRRLEEKLDRAATNGWRRGIKLNARLARHPTHRVWFQQHSDRMNGRIACQLVTNSKKRGRIIVVRAAPLLLLTACTQQRFTLASLLSRVAV